MKFSRFIIVLMGAGVFAACETNIVESDLEPPAAPRGVYSVTGDNQVVLSWYPNGESDLDGYSVYRSFNDQNGYQLIADVGNARFVDADVDNGVTYYYAVTAYDLDGNESELSPEVVQDTPRPEGFGVRMSNLLRVPEAAGYDFSNYSLTDFQAQTTDIYFGRDVTTGGYFIYSFSDDTDLQDYGYTESFDDVDYAPENGWSALGYTEAIPGHTYIVWTHDNHFAKLRVTAVNPDFVEFDWAYQIVEGNPELAKVSKRSISAQKEKHNEK